MLPLNAAFSKYKASKSCMALKRRMTRSNRISRKDRRARGSSGEPVTDVMSSRSQLHTIMRSNQFQKDLKKRASPIPNSLSTTSRRKTTPMKLPIALRTSSSIRHSSCSSYTYVERVKPPREPASQPSICVCTANTQELITISTEKAISNFGSVTILSSRDGESLPSYLRPRASSNSFRTSSKRFRFSICPNLIERLWLHVSIIPFSFLMLLLSVIFSSIFSSSPSVLFPLTVSSFVGNRSLA
mmetsp:Transcript_15305/g.27882  ORF Transcript_15305/g.27882 Transcript_15305/m.27882 type:complete len:243 (+) Transcript_15305:337-1065(+)